MIMMNRFFNETQQYRCTSYFFKISVEIDKNIE